MEPQLGLTAQGSSLWGFLVFGSSVVMFAGSSVGLILLAAGQALVVVCMCFDMVRALSVPRSHRRYVASTVFRTLAVPSIIAAGMSVLIDALAWSWMDVAMSMFVMVAIIFRLHHDKDEDNWWKGKGKKLARWARRQFSSGTSVAPAIG
ncbi:hypothetical protein AHiyo4_47780 [Arthrobacter sp. Hiyo4]|nr:hypothetical protein AHiyo4_47780 [Arthrobacter sp. Hiyo4]